MIRERQILSQTRHLGLFLVALAQVGVRVVPVMTFPTPEGSRPPHILLAVHRIFGYHRQILNGLLDYLDKATDWTAAAELPMVGARLMPMIERHKPDGVIIEAWRFPEEDIESLKSTGLPAVLVLGRPRKDFCCVLEDDDATAKLALDHLDKSGLQHVAYLANIWGGPVQERETAFLRAVHDAGRTCLIHPTRDFLAKTEEQAFDAFTYWLTQLPPATGIFCFTAPLAIQAAEFCHKLGIRIPEDVALLGYAADTLEARLTRPALSYVELDGLRYGREAAALLHRIMRGEITCETTLFIKPRGIVAHKSTDYLMTVDPHLKKAVQYIRDHCRENLQLPRVAAHAGMSVRGLQRAFREILQSNFHEQLARIRLNKAEQLLLRTDDTLETIAHGAGFPHASHFCKVFKKHHGTTPTRWRKQNRAYHSLGGSGVERARGG
jgi:LacI family transcriptional regulator